VALAAQISKQRGEDKQSKYRRWMCISSYGVCTIIYYRSNVLTYVCDDV
jgi:hypothetical protein